MKIEYIKKLGKESLIYGVGGVVSKFLSVFLLPVLARIFSPNDYGTIDLLTTSFSIIFMVVILGLDGALTFYYFDSKHDERDKYINSVTSFEMIIACIVSLVIIFLSDYISRIIFSSINYSIYIKMIAVTTPFELFISFGMRVTRLYFRPWLYNVIVFGRFILYAITTVIFVVFLKMSIYGYFLGQIVTCIVLSVFILVVLRKTWKFTIQIEYLKKMLFYGVPLVPVSFAYWLMNSSGRYFLQHYCSIDDIGYYAVALKIATLISLVISAVDLAWVPFALSIKNEPNFREVYANIFNMYIYGTLGIVLFITAFAHPAIYYLAAPQYLPGAFLVGYLALIQVVNVYYNFVSIGLNLTKKTYLISYTSGITAGLSIIFNYLLIPHFGLEGAVLSLVVSYSISAICTFWLSQKFYLIPYDLKKIGQILLIFGVLFAGMRFIKIENSIIDTVIKIIMSCIYVLIVCVKFLTFSKISQFIRNFNRN